MNEEKSFLVLDKILQSLVDFIRPDTFIAQDDLENFQQLKEKFRRKSTTKELGEIQSIRSNSAIYRFLSQHSTSRAIANHSSPIDRDELLKKLHEKMPHHQQTKENGVDHRAKRKLSKEKSKEREKKPRPMPKEPKIVRTPTESTKSSISFGRFEFKSDDQIETKSKSKKKTKFESKTNQLKKTLKQIENEEEQLKRLNEENPTESKEILRSKHWKSALAKAKGEKVRDNVQLLKKSLKKEEKRKERAAKKWKVKKSETDKRMKERQEKRQTNLQKRKDEKKAKIKKRLIKKGRLIS